MTCPPSFRDKTSLSMSAAPACGGTRRKTAKTINTSFFMQRSDNADEMVEDRMGFSTQFFQARPVVEGADDPALAIPIKSGKVRVSESISIIHDSPDASRQHPPYGGRGPSGRSSKNPSTTVNAGLVMQCSGLMAKW